MIVALTGLAAALDSLSIMVLVTAGMAVILMPGASSGQPEIVVTAKPPAS